MRSCRTVIAPFLSQLQMRPLFPLGSISRSRYSLGDITCLRCLCLARPPDPPSQPFLKSFPAPFMLTSLSKPFSSSLVPFSTPSFRVCNTRRRLNSLPKQERDSEIRSERKVVEKEPEKKAPVEVKAPTYWERFKEMYKKYWYVLLPVHGITSVGWMVVLYLVVKSGFDIVPLLEKIGFSERIIGPFRQSGRATYAYLATAYAIYHLISPLRYSTTLGLTTLSISYLRRLGYIKPVPSKAEMRRMVVENTPERIKVMSKRLTRRAKSLSVSTGKMTERMKVSTGKMTERVKREINKRDKRKDK